MALGTLVAAAVAYSGAGGGAGTVSPAYPANIATTDVVVLIIGQKPATANGGGIGTLTGWTLRESLSGAGGYGNTLQADQGNTNLFIYTWNSPVAGQTGNLSVSLTDNNIAWAFIARIPTDGGTIVFGSADGSRTTAPTSGTAYTVTLTNGTTATNLQSGDVAVWAMTIPTDVLGGTGFSAHTLSATGTTFGTPTEINEASSGTNNDIGGYSAWVSATAGSSTASPVVGATATGTVTNVRGPIVLVRIRELPFINAESGTFTYTGQAATLADNRVINAESGSFTYTGQDATLARTRNFNAEAGSFTYTGQDATLTATRSLNAESGSFSYIGQDANLAVGYVVNAEVGTFTYTGQDADLAKGSTAKILDAEVGTFTYTGEDAAFAITRNINAEEGTFTYTGEDATLNRTYSFDAEVGVFTYTGEDAELIYVQARTIDAEAGTFDYTGQDATLNRTYLFDAEVGTFTYTGEDATLLAERALDAEVGTFTYTGQNAVFEVEGAFDAGSFTYTGQDATFIRTNLFNAEQGAFGEANPYVDQGYVNPGYVTGLTATLIFGKAFNAQSGIFTYTGQSATLRIGSLYPPENEVLAGVIYGPGGIYEGTYVCPPAQNKQILYIFDD